MTRWPELRLSVARLRRRDRGELRLAEGDSLIEVDRVVVAGDDIGISTAQVPPGSDVAVRGTVTSGVNGIEFVGTVAASWQGECRRCLDLVESDIALDVRVLFTDDPDHVDDDADTYELDDDRIDIGAVVYEELMLALPLSPLCEDDCSGSDPERFPSSGAADEPPEADDGPPERDPRWAALDALTFDDESARESVDEGGGGPDNL